MGVLAVASWLGDLDFTPLPDLLEAVLAPLAGVAAGLGTSWAVRRRRIRVLTD